MKIKDLLKEIKECQEEYGEDFLEWDIYTEQCSEDDKKCKKTGCQSIKQNSKNGWKIFKDSEDWEYFECVGFWIKIPKKKIFTINVNY